MSSTPHPLDFPLIKFSKDPADWWTIRHAVTGVQIFGGIGSGKSSGSGQTIAYSFLKNGFGGIVLTGKIDETETWLRYVKETNRLKDVIIFGAKRDEVDLPKDDAFKDLRNKEYKFNPLAYLNTDKTASKTSNLVSLFFPLSKLVTELQGVVIVEVMTLFGTGF